MLDVGMLMYVGLVILALWRSLCYYQCCGVWLSFLNYISLLYVGLACCVVYSLRRFYVVIQQPLAQQALENEGDVWGVSWLRNFVFLSPVAIGATVLISWFQAEAHVFEIRKQVGRDKHDRAVQIIALPAVFGVMVMAGLVPIVELITGHVSPDMLEKPFGIEIDMRDWLDQERSDLGLGLAEVGTGVTMPPFPPHLSAGLGGIDVRNASVIFEKDAESWSELTKVAMWRYETCFYVADLFEAWALYQFGRLALELIRESYGTDINKELRSSLAAVESLTWLGTITFVVVCATQTATSLWPYIGGADAEEKLNIITTSFQVAGFFASGAAIYNIFVVERAFHDQLASCYPVLKFLSVKVLVSLGFFQRGLIVVLQIANQLLPGSIRYLVTHVPVVGDILNFSPVQMHLFYPALVLYECLLAALMHIWAWRSNEDWYEGFCDEQTRLIPNAGSKRAAAIGDDNTDAVAHP